MLLQRWNPLFDFRRRHYFADRTRQGFPQTLDAAEPKRWSIALDAVEENEKLVVRASLAGVDLDKIKVIIEDGVFTIDGETKVDDEVKVGNYLFWERRAGSFHRSVRLTESVDVDQAGTNYDEGVLTVAVLKAESKRAKQLTVTNEKALKSDEK